MRPTFLRRREAPSRTASTVFTLLAAFSSLAAIGGSVHAQGVICDSDPAIPCLENRGGPVLGNLKIVNLYMSANWDTDNSAFGFTRQRIDDFTRRLVSSSYFWAARPDYGIQSASFAGSFDASGLNRATCLTPSLGGVTDSVTIQAWITCLAAAGPVPITSSTLGLNATNGNITPPDGNTLYVIYVPKGTKLLEAGSNCGHFAGYHFFSDVPKWEWNCGFNCTFDFCFPFCCAPSCGPRVTSQRFAYAIVPVECSNGDFNALTAVASHEIAEAATDPIDFTGWTENNLLSFDGEIGDLCEARPDRRFAMSDGDVVSTYWSTSSRACFPESGTVTITDQDPRAITDLRVTTEFQIDGNPHSDFEDAGNFDRTINLGLDADGPHGGSWDGSKFVGNFLFSQSSTSGSKVLTIHKTDARNILGLRISVTFKINGQPHFDFEDVGTLSGTTNLILNANGGGSFDGSRWVGNFLRH